jgi:hypothetical protein
LTACVHCAQLIRFQSRSASAVAGQADLALLESAQRYPFDSQAIAPEAAGVWFARVATTTIKPLGAERDFRQADDIYLICG